MSLKYWRRDLWIGGLAARRWFSNKLYGFPLRLVTVPPASWIMRMPAAMSQGIRPFSQKPSRMPQATYAKSREAAPQRRIPWVMGSRCVK